MGRVFIIRIVCVLAALVMVFLCGCTNMDPARTRRHRYSVSTDFEHMKDDIDWLLGIHRPVYSYDETMLR